MIAFLFGPFVNVYVCLFFSYSLHLVRFGQLLGCADTRIVNIVKVYTETTCKLNYYEFVKIILTLLLLQTD